MMCMVFYDMTYFISHIFYKVKGSYSRKDSFEYVSNKITNAYIINFKVWIKATR